MKADGIAITWIAPGEELEHRDRRGFVDVCGYGPGMECEHNEVGCIASITGKPALSRSGLWVTPIKVHERIFVVEPEAAPGRFRHQKGKP